jgi:septal ring factor EnvC (AmiA/AmiB activator)
MRARAFALGLALALCLCAPPASADEESDLAAWKQRLEEAQAQVVDAQERAGSAEVAYQRMRHDRSMRGAEKAKVMAERAESEHAVGDAKARLEALREQARRAGVPPGWIYTDPPQAPSGSDDPPASPDGL